MRNPSYKEARETQLSEIGAFSIARFYLDEPQGYPVKQAHILAAAYFDGYWIDIHISKTGKERPDQGALVEFLKTVSIR